MVQELWQEFLKIVTQEVGSRVVETWFKAVFLERWDAGERVAYLKVPNEFVKNWITSHYFDLCRTHLARLLGEKNIRLVIDSAVIVEKQSSSTITAARVVQFNEKKPVELSVKEPISNSIVVRKKQKKRLNPHVYTFDSFVVGPSNELAFSAAYAVAERVGMHYNPLFLYGGSGLGKTHLLHAIGSHIQQKSAEKVVRYIPADKFVQEFIQAIRFDKMIQFQAMYKKIDVLLIDDIQVISRKEQTQEAFFHIFNTLHQAQKQIVLTADSMPRDIAGLADRIKSRLEWGLVADILMPTLETRMAILRKKAEAYQALIEDDVLDFLASYDFSNVREMEGALIRVIASAALSDASITKAFISNVIVPTERKPSVIDIPSIARAVCKRCQVNLQELRSINRTKELVFSRHVAMFLMKKLTDASLREIGTFFNRKDHTTVIHAIESVECKSKNNAECMQIIRDIECHVKKLNA
jgi:chromosomal replication initiator protein